MRLAVLVPQAELGAQAEMLRRRGKYRWFGRIEGREQLGQSQALGLQLRVVVGRIECNGHQLKNPSLTMNSAEST